MFVGVVFLYLIFRKKKPAASKAAGYFFAINNYLQAASISLASVHPFPFEVGCDKVLVELLTVNE